MSRPFSYNDENFTVIGNVLFCHIKVVKNTSAGNEIIKIPPAIADRLLHSTSHASTVVSDFNKAGLKDFTLYVRTADSYYYFSTSMNITTNADYIISYYILKDI